MYAFRAMEDPSCIGDVPYLVQEFVKDCKFVSSHEMRLASYDVSDAATKERAITSKKCIVATGASPIMPENSTKDAEDGGEPFFTYRSLLRPKQFTSSTLLQVYYHHQGWRNGL